MQAAVALRKVSINSVTIVAALVVALAAGGIGGYLLKSQAPSAVGTSGPARAAGEYQQLAPFHDMPETVQARQAAPFHDMPESP
jgi:hypothetical protein